ncbi:FAD-dependent oxidoreductase [Nocardia brasiliensis]|uniref:FAD-dependent oxidoreductase n=1 Tax=Nocardia brasiliensis TaxID=37326 RepID=UPI003D89BB8B
MDEFDVVIVGAGPVGLLLACELGLAHCSVLVLEREPDPGSPWRAEPLGRRGLSAASAEVFYRRGLLPALRKATGAPDDLRTGFEEDLPPRHIGHFAGLVLEAARVEFADLPYYLPSPALHSMMVTLAALESVLTERAVALGVQIQRGTAVSAIAQDDDQVLVHAGARTYAARWAVGCDGGRSVVRKLAGFEFVGTEPQFTGYVALADIADAERLDEEIINRTATGVYLRLAANGHIGMMDFDGGAFDRTQRLTREHLQEVLRRVSGTDVTLDAVHFASSFTDRAMQTTTYRQGRVLLAGDAAHIHSPLGGQGLNLGIGDAMNLGWKLAATVHGTAPTGLLDTYTAERHPIGAAVLDWSRAQVAILRPDPIAGALRGVIQDLLATADGTTYGFERSSGASIRYDLGGTHPMIGRSAPDFRFDDDTRLGDLTHDGRGVLLDFGADPSLRTAIAAWSNRIRYVAATPRDDLGVGAVLIRPDGFVAWAGERDAAAFESAAAHWFSAA